MEKKLTTCIDNNIKQERPKRTKILTTGVVLKHDQIAQYISTQTDICLPTFWGPGPQKFEGNARVYPEKVGNPPLFYFCPFLPDTRPTFNLIIY